MVTLTLVASDPLTLIPVYPIPAPASEVVTTPGKYCNKIGKSCPKFLDSKSLAFTLEKDTPIAFVALRALTKTSFKAMSFWCAIRWLLCLGPDCCCEQCCNQCSENNFHS